MTSSVTDIAKGVSSLSDIFDKMEYGPALEDNKTAKAWLEDHNKKFGHFINNEWILPQGRKTYDTKDPFAETVLASTVQGEKEDVDLAVSSAKVAFESWSKLSCHKRARCLYSIARHVQKHARLIAVIESMDNGKTVRESRDCDIPLVARHFYYHAGWAQLMDSEMKNWKAIGVVGAIVPWNFPLMLLSWKVAPALAMGNTVVLKPATNTRLSALLFAEICAEAGLPPGVFNVVTGSGKLGSMIASHPDVGKVGFTGSTEIGKLLRKLTAGTGKKLSLELGGKSPIVVYDSADLDSAVEGVVDAIWFNQGQVCSAGSRLLVQEPVYEKFIAKLRNRMDKLRLGSSLDKAVDMGVLIDETQRKTVEEYVQFAKKEGAEIYQIDCPKGCFYPPTLITGIGTTSRCFVEEIFGPVLVAIPFRTAKEAVALANNSMYGLGGSVFTEKLTLAVETAKFIKSGAVWINCHNIFDAAAGFGGYKQSGFGRDGGKEGLYEYVQLKWQKNIIFTPPEVDLKTFGASYLGDRPAISVQADSDCSSLKIDRTYKLYYGGAQKRPDGNYSRIVYDAKGNPFSQVGESNRKDVRNAVEAALKAQPNWEKRNGFNRSQILFYLAENLEQRREDIAHHIHTITGENMEVSRKEVDSSIDRLFYWAAMCDKYGGAIQETVLYGTVLRYHEPVGVIGIACPKEHPLLAFISLVAPAIARGNAVVVIPSEEYPTVALFLYQVLETSDVPGGVINILTGSRDHITKHLTEHQDVQAMWYFGSLEGSTFVENTSAVNLKRTWVNYGFERDWNENSQGKGEEFLYHATQVKNIWLTMGDIFAN